MNYIKKHQKSQASFLSSTKDDDCPIELSILSLDKTLLEHDDTHPKDNSYDNYELDCVDISRGRVTQRKFQNQVFQSGQRRKLFCKVDVPEIFAQKDASNRFRKYLIFCFYHLVINGLLIFKTIQDEPALARTKSIVAPIMTEYKTDPMIEIKASDASNSCPPSYDSVLLEKWPGTYAACYCPSEKTLKQGECKSHSNLSGDCSDIQETPSSNLYTWNGVSSFCIKRAQLQSDYVKSEICPEGYKTCSFGVCMADSVPCPITSFLITNNSSVNSESIQIDNFKYITPQREIDKPPLVSVTITQNFGTSLFLKENSSKSEDQESLDQELNRILDTSDAWSLIATNHITGDIYENPVYQSNLERQKVDLIARRRLEMINKEKCFGKEDNPDLYDNYLYGSIRAFNCGAMLHNTFLILALAYYHYKNAQQVQKFFQKCSAQLMVLGSWIGIWILWFLSCSYIWGAQDIVSKCFQSPALNQIIRADPILLYMFWGVLNCFCSMFPLFYFGMIKD